MTQTKKVLAILLAVLMLALSMPFAAAEGEAAELTTGGEPVLYSTVQAAIDAIPTGGSGTIKVLKPEIGNLSLNADKTVVLDLDGKEVEGSLTLYQGHVTLQNGQLYGDSQTVNVYGSKETTFAAGAYNSLTVADDATVGKDTANYGIILREYEKKKDAAYGTKIEINGNVKGCVWVMGNIKQGNSVINVNEGASIFAASDEGEDVGIALNGYATVNVKGGTIIAGTDTASGTGIEVRAGELNVTGGKVTGNGADSFVPNGNGTTSTGCGIAVAQHTTKNNIKVEISDGAEVAGTVALAIANPQENEDGEISVSVKGGTFTSTAATDPVVVSLADNETRVNAFVSGGTFSSAIPEAYLVDGVVMAALEDGTHVMTLFEASEATETKHGNIAFFADADGKYYIFADNQYTEIALADTVIHKLALTSGAVATCEDDGNSAYYTCSCENCNKYFSDSDGKYEIEEDSWVLPKLGHVINGSTINWMKTENGYRAAAFCTRCEETLKMEAAFEVNQDGAATCDSPATGRYYVEISGNKYFKEGTETNGAALGHNYQFSAFVWSADKTTAQAKLVCSRCSGEKLENAAVTPVAHEATCTEDAYTVYTATYGTTDPETDSKTVTAQNTKLGHIYDNGVAVYNDDNATHNKICDRCREPSAPVACFSNANVGWSGNTATCTEPGKEYRTCPVCDHQYERDTTALGHNYGAVTHFDPDSNNYVKAQVPCSRCDGITERKPVELSETPATCSKTGLKLWFVKFDNAVFNDEGKDYYTVKTETIPINPEAHDYAFKGFTWTDGENGTATAVANFVCNNNSAHTQMPAATVEKDEAASVAPTCAAAGKNVYTASVTFNNETYGAEETPYEVTLAKLPHTYGEQPRWDWTDDTHATATFVCENCDAADAEGNPVDGHSVTLDAVVTTSTEEDDTVAATCTGNGSHKNIATVTFEEKDYTDDRTVTDPATGHTYAPEGETPWNWTKAEEGGYTATVTVKCSKCQDLQTLNAEVEKTVEVVPTCTKAGSKTYTATATIGEGDKAQTFTDTRVDTIKANGHSVEAVSEEAATCTKDGNKAYTYCSVCDVILTLDGEDVEAQGLKKTDDTTAYTLSATGHTYGEPADDDWTWAWNEEKETYDVTVTVSCEKEDDEQELTAEIAVDRNPATHLEDGKAIYTATATIGEQTFTDTNVDTLKAEGHSSVEVAAVPATCTEGGNKAYTYCSVCNVILTLDGKDVEEADYDKTDDAFVYTLGALGHDYSTCQYVDEEQHVYICSHNANHKIYDEHYTYWTTENYVEPTYAAKGSYDRVCYCPDCGKVFSRTTYTIDPIPHDHIYDMKVTKEATCKEEGVKTFTCQYCGDVKTETIPKSGQHGEKNSDGYCSICGADLSADARCKQCGQIHTGFFGGIVGFFHKIAYFFTHLFG